MSSRLIALIASGLVLSSSGPIPASLGPCDRALRKLEGWTVAKVGTIKGTFNGCESDRLVEFSDGTLFRCASYGYQYAYAPEAVVFAKTATFQGKSLTQVKLMVESEVYDMSPLTK